MNPTSIYSKTGKGVQEASGKTSLLSRADRAVLTQIDGKTTFADLQIKFYKIDAAKLEALVLQLDKDGSCAKSRPPGAQPAPAPIARHAGRAATCGCQACRASQGPCRGTRFHRGFRPPSGCSRCGGTVCRGASRPRRPKRA
jgi:hypothetical protein